MIRKTELKNWDENKRKKSKSAVPIGEERGKRENPAPEQGKVRDHGK